ncbi:trypsin-like peptidase domain-containing protein [Mycobacterium helveticum]|uniref:Zinc-ribbon domain-containing protein n=1 Tax=Mycobacterium helveticum TaxID=2592811 RepID=A0A557XLS2_9MYCO|nr:trypsin-like peptidase domain-containing protein [Mycobacterium helveticum]TVS84568.1 zinc-ribbon domain-containing protein [Mycobacterium helveticum]TVS86771.1 zinc-ribbon domain-containing protein [Mycobacterium helveticum]
MPVSSWGRTFAALSAAALAVLTAPAGTASADGGRPQPNPQERAAAIIRPAVMYLAGQAYGQVRLPNGQLLSQFGEGSNIPFTATWFCTAFVVNPDGWVATSGHCVDPDSAKDLIFKRAANEYVIQYPDSPIGQNPAAVFQWLRQNAKVEGDAPDLGPQPALTVVYGSGTRVVGKLLANVVDFRPIGKGDVAVLKVERHNMPSSELASDADISIGTPILAVGYPESTKRITDPSLDPTNKSGTVSKKSSMGSVPEYEIDAPVTEGMSGGPTVALNGKVIGVNSFSPAGEPQPFNFVAPAGNLAALLAGKGVTATLGPADLFYRKGLDQFYSGRYTDAIDDFDQALAMSPDYPGLVELKTSAVNLRQRYGDASVLRGTTLMWYVIGAVVLVLAAGGGLTFLVVRSRWHLYAPPKATGIELFSPGDGDTAAPARARGGIKAGAARLIGAAPAPKSAQPHFCSSCGAEHHPAEKFCPNCGKEILPGESAVGADRTG